jgi:D-glycero-alpha-D-manno-heptose-7-phosphate kinase
MSFVGGGSDIPSFYRKYGGAVLSTAIDKYIYVSVNQKFDGGIRVAYSKTEEVEEVSEIEHRIVRETLTMLGVKGGVEITTTADIPSRGTGLGSSSAFTVGLIQAMSAYLGRHCSAEELGRRSCEIEIERCLEPIGKQDQYASAFGGFNMLEFRPDDSVAVSPIIMSSDLLKALEDQIVVYFTGITRSASAILKRQSEAVASTAGHQSALRRMTELAYVMRDELHAGNLSSFGEILDENWLLKRGLAEGISNAHVDNWYQLAKANGATGGKLLGAGAGGFLMFVAPPERHDDITRALALRQVKFGFEASGARILFYRPQSAHIRAEARSESYGLAGS